MWMKLEEQNRVYKRIYKSWHNLCSISLHITYNLALNEILVVMLEKIHKKAKDKTFNDSTAHVHLIIIYFLMTGYYFTEYYWMIFNLLQLKFMSNINILLAVSEEADRRDQWPNVWQSKTIRNHQRRKYELCSSAEDKQTECNKTVMDGLCYNVTIPLSLMLQICSSHSPHCPHSTFPHPFRLSSGPLWL